MTDDIVARLRVWSDWLNERCPDTEVRNDLRAAAGEIERLREELTASHESHGNEVGALTERLSLAIHERDEARHGECVATATLQGCIEERTALRAERDEARRMYCRAMADCVNPYRSPEDIAVDRGWECFAKGGEG